MIFGVPIDEVVKPTIPAQTPPDGGLGQAYSYQVTTGGGAPTGFNLVVKDGMSGAALTGHGLSINSSGLVTGTPSLPSGASGYWTLEITASNAGGSSVASFSIHVYQAYAAFTPDAANPASPYVGAPGFVKIVGSGAGGYSLASGAVLVNASPVLTNSGLISADGSNNDLLVTRRDGLALMASLLDRVTVDSNMRLGFSDAGLGSSNILIGGSLANSTSLAPRDGTQTIDTITIGAGEHQIICIMRAAGGGFLLAREGNSGNFTVLWGYPLAGASSANLYAKLRLTAVNANFKLSRWRLLDLGAAFVSSLISVYHAVSTAGQVVSMPSESRVEHTITVSTGVIQELLVRRTADDEAWVIRLDPSDNSIRLFQKEPGGETARGNNTLAQANGAVIRVVVWCHGQTIDVYANNSKLITYASASFNLTGNTAKVSHVGAQLAVILNTIAVPGA